MPLQPFYYDGLTFSAATNVFTDPTLATPGPDGFYALGGIVRTKTGGILGPPQPCPSCAIPCSVDGFTGSGNDGVYTVEFELGTTPGAAILTFSPGVWNDTCLPIPDSLTWTYNGVSASEYSSLVGGYQTGMIGAPDGPPKGGTQCNACVETGVPSNPSATAYTYDSSTSTFVPGPTIVIPALTGLGNFSPLPQPECTLLDWNNTNPSGTMTDTLCNTQTGLSFPVGSDGSQPAAPNLPLGGIGNWPASNNEYRGATMVIPSPPGVGSTILQVVVTAPCVSTWWGLTVECPRELSGFSASDKLAQGTAKATVCAAAMTQTLYHVPIDAFGNSNPQSSYFNNDNFPTSGKSGQPDGVLGFHDWLFTDPYGETPAPVGEYKIESPAGSGTFYHVSVGVREYRDVNTVGGTCAPNANTVHALPPEGYSGSYNGVVGTTQTSGPYVPGIVRSMVLC